MFGASAGLLDVVVAGEPDDESVNPGGELCEAKLGLSGATTRMALLGAHGKCDSVAEVENLLRFDLEPLVGTEPIFKQTADGGDALEAGAEATKLPYSAGSKEAQHLLEVPAIPSVERLSHTLEQDISKVPALGDIPILGQLFRSNRYQRGETELVIIVTPYLVKPASTVAALQSPTDGFIPPHDTQTIINGATYRQTLPAGEKVRVGPGAEGLVGPVGFRLD